MIGSIESTRNPRRAGPWGLIPTIILISAAGLPSTAMAQRAKILGPAPVAAPAPASEPKPLTDPEVKPAEGPPAIADAENPLPAAKDAPPGAAASSGDAADTFGVLPSDRMTQGRQRVQLSVEVQASPVINLGKESTVKLFVANESNVDAYGIAVDYHLPDGLKIVSSTPEGLQDPVDKSRYSWRKPMLATNAPWTIVLKVVATAVKPCEHAAIVTAHAGSRMSTMIQEPKLKVEATVTPGRVLKGSSVDFRISVTNPGSGPARNVTVQAKLSSGLKSGNDEIVEQTIEVIKPGQRVDLDDLQVDTIAGGLQTCTVDVRSPDVNPDPETARVVRNVEVTKPELAVKLSGQEARFTGQDIEYKLSVSNPGSAPAKKIKVLVTLPGQGGAVKPGSYPGGKLIMPSRKLAWLIDQLEPGQSVDKTFVYETNSPGLYQTSAEATSGELHPVEQMTTNVAGLPQLDLQISQPAIKVIDVGKTTEYDITIKNTGTKEATKLLISGQLTNLKILKHYGVEKGEFNFNKDTGQFIFPVIDRLAAGATLTLSLDVEATKSGQAVAKISLAYSEDEEGKIEDSIATKVTAGSRVVK